MNTELSKKYMVLQNGVDAELFKKEIKMKPKILKLSLRETSKDLMMIEALTL